IRESVPMPSRTCSTSAPTASQTLATALIKEIFMARKALDACLISSALLALVRSKFAGNGVRLLVIAAIHQRLVRLSQQIRAAITIGAHHNAVRIEEVSHGSSFTQ